MHGEEFARVRSRLNKTQTQLASLLGVSAKAVQSFEQGWRAVPVHVERHVLFLLYLRQRPFDDPRPCWERRDCSPAVRDKCIAWEVRAGELCWCISGTWCHGEIQSDWAEKMQMCRQCEVFRSQLQLSPGS